MGYPGFGLEPVMAFRILLDCIACIIGGAALIGLWLYLFLLCSEIFFSNPGAKSQTCQNKAATRNVPVAKAGLQLSADERTLAGVERIGSEALCAPKARPQFPVTLENKTAAV
jgi:hypothetical protein